MKLGILADIHEDLDSLRRALEVLRRERVDRTILLGDVFYDGTQIVEAIELLESAGASGVWGNHDLGFCDVPAPELTARYPARVFEYSRKLTAHVQVEDCLFSHGLPHWDATDPAVFYLGERLTSNEALANSFAFSPCRVSFIGHFHRWLCATPTARLAWRGEGPIVLDAPQRYLVVFGAVCDGWCATYDTATAELVPFRLDDRRAPSGN